MSPANRRHMKIPELGNDAVGRRLVKLFDGESYGGEVVEYLSSKGWYLVRYEDGDQEDMLWTELEKLLTPAPAGLHSNPASPAVTGPIKYPRAPKESALKSKVLPSAEPCQTAPPTYIQQEASAAPTSDRISELAIHRGSIAGSKDIEDCILEYNRLRLEAIEEENARVASAGGMNPEGKKQSRRPDLVAMKKLRANGGKYPKEKVSGDIPGIPVGFKFWSRAEMAVTGAHFAPVSGIEYVTEAQDKEGGYVTSVVMSGNYEGGHGDEHAADGEIVYDGAGGCNLLHDRRQIADQTLDRGNLAFTGNYKRGIPVRVTRKNKCPESYTKSSFTYDGLWDVVDWWSERPQTDFNPGFLVYRYRLKRREGQPKLEILTQAEEKAANDRMREEAREKREAEKAQRQAADKLVKEAVMQTKAAARETARQAKEEIKRTKIAARETIKQTRDAVKETKAVLREVRQATSQSVGIKRKLTSPGVDRSLDSAPVTESSLLQTENEHAHAFSVDCNEGINVQKALPLPRELEPWTKCLPQALGVAEFLGSFGDLLEVEVEGLPGKAISLALSGHDCCDGNSWEQAKEWFLPVCKALLLKAGPLSDDIDEIRSERWKRMLASSPITLARDVTLVEILRRCGYIPGPGDVSPAPKMQELQASDLITALERLCNAAMIAPDLRGALEDRMQQRAELQKELQAWSKAERRRVQEAEANERAVQEKALAEAADSIKCKAVGPATEGLAIEELRQLQRDAKEQADALGKMRLDARKAVMAAAAEAAQDFAIESRERVLDAEQKLATLEIRRMPLGHDRNGASYWWLPEAAWHYVMLQSADGEWTGCYPEEDLPALLEALNPNDGAEEILMQGIRKTLSTMEVKKGPCNEPGNLQAKTSWGMSYPSKFNKGTVDLLDDAAAVVLELCRVTCEAGAALGADVPESLKVMDKVTVSTEDTRRQLLVAEETLVALLEVPAVARAHISEDGSSVTESDNGDMECKEPPAHDGEEWSVDETADERFLDTEDQQRRRALVRQGLWPEGQQARDSWRRELEGPGGALHCSQAYLAATLAERAWPPLKTRLAKSGTSLDEIMGLRVTRARKRQAATM